MEFPQLRDAMAGIVAIPVTPFAPNGAIDGPAYRAVLNHMVDHGIKVVTPNGNTSEYYALSPAETREVLDATVDAVGITAVIVAGVGGSLPQAVEAAEHARAAGAHAIMIHQPVHPSVSRSGWVDYQAEIAAAVPELGVVIYLRNPTIEGSDIGELAGRAPNLVAVKYAVPDPVRFATVMQGCQAQNIVWIAGLAESSAPGYFAYGATGFTSGLVNLAPELSLDLLDALRSGDREKVMGIWATIRPFEELRARNNSEHNVSVVKEALAQLGLCSRDVRPPISTLNDDDRATVTGFLGALVGGRDLARAAS
ncbi:4-hydroxy-tetrahydrodipicolinate synthase [Arthrobacter sp. CAN_A214]|uniref:dihydrodipicolinate synthase family protein n=1 Tax=Arthrobacter sp. CAN_A214 TaxID=2787720 RepID=UPI001A2AAEAE